MIFLQFFGKKYFRKNIFVKKYLFGPFDAYFFDLEGVGQ